MSSSPPGTGDYLSDVFFTDLPLPHAVRAGIAACGFVRATPVQASTLPLLLAGKDVAAQAQTGTGKTAAYLVSILTRLVEAPSSANRKPGAPRALIVAPTRELAVQIEHDAILLSQFVRPRIVTVFGGLDYVRQRSLLQAGCDILIGTPGRLLDYEGQGATSFGSVESLVIDECDRLFDMGFLPDLRRILRRCPPPRRRQSMMFSATLSWRVTELAWEHMNEAVRVEIAPEHVTADRVVQSLFHVGNSEKLSLLVGLLQREGNATRTMLFVNTKRFAERLVERLERHGLRCGAISGDIPQAKRLKILADFKSGKLPILVATDVASRGLHIDGVTHVINVDLPMDPEDYVHRIGRTARAGHSGRAISLACENYVQSLSSIEKLIGMKIPVEHPDDALFVRRPAPLREPVRVSGGPRSAAPVAGDEEEDTKAPPPPRASRPRRERAAAPPRPEPVPAAPAPRVEKPQAPPATAPEPFVPDIPVAPVAPVVRAEAVVLAEAAAPLAVARVEAAKSGAPAEPAADLPGAVEPPPGDVAPTDFWTCAAFELEIPEGGFGVSASPAAPGGASRRKRHRRRKPASAPSAS
ncbi:MAG TPA: DEAD/DEAH box helicase [Thermoanaerobaculia bacterium]|jgi:ATP-dependent RNA helicase RhlB|nr:DEAD/DEAH box helicase [Thermoanaerobaculia bacterium]HPA50099.1 DEAD/DEAH box helicase [Thermoanaerobaculia bacterium]HQN06756.1 DEAD/DEAH box helicase [Thermoanaerobaculia bacterium]HQP85325.1 DEAD/DEAH box helicase [Thermoanaerobaculia bacterium]